VIKLDIGSLPEGSSHLEIRADASELGVDLDEGRLESPVEVDLNVTRRENDIFLTGSARVKAILECGRCLDEYAMMLESPIEVWVAVSGRSEATGCEQERDNVIEVAGGAKYADLTDHVRSELFVLIPLKPLCKKGCQGLCPKCGVNLNTSSCTCEVEKHDSRWDALKKLK
jgi:uncharacterized protein